VRKEIGMAFTPEESGSTVDLLDRPLWHLEFADGTLCVVEEEEEYFLLLFTSSERAGTFASENDLGQDTAAAPVLFSQNEEEFEQGVEQVADGGLDGAIIDPGGAEEEVIVRFTEPADEEAEA
jgi:hypothetical protein